MGRGLDDQHARLFIVILSLSISSVLTIILLAFLLWLLAKYPAKTKLPPGLIEEIEKAKVDMHDIQILEKEMRNQRDSLGVKSKDIQEKLEMLKSQHQEDLEKLKSLKIEAKNAISLVEDYFRKL